MKLKTSFFIVQHSIYRFPKHYFGASNTPTVFATKPAIAGSTTVVSSL